MKPELDQLVKFSPSAAERWVNCPAAAVVAAMPSKYQPSIFAATGTAIMHHVETAVENFEEVEYFDGLLGKTEKIEGFDITYTESDIEAAKECFSKIAEIEAGGGVIEVEKEISGVFRQANGAVARVKGRMDFCCTFPDRYEIVDYKHGEGVAVSAQNNWQLFSYLVCLVDCRGPKEKYALRIIQPRSRGQKDSAWEITNEQLSAIRPGLDAVFIRAFAAAGHLYHEGELYFTDYKAGDWCQWCAIKPTCPARINRAISAACGSRLPYEQGLHLKYLLDNGAEIKAIVSKAEEFAESELLAGRKVFGYKLIESFGNRSLKEVFTAEQIEELRSAKLVEMKEVFPTTVGAIEKAAKKKLIADPESYFSEGQRKPKMVPWEVEGTPWNAVDEYETTETEKTEE